MSRLAAIAAASLLAATSPGIAYIPGPSIPEVAAGAGVSSRRHRRVAKTLRKMPEETKIPIPSFGRRQRERAARRAAS